MRLVSFQVSGFKNFVDPISLTGLGPFVVLHGDNNVGKSNLLKAIQLFVSILPIWRGDGGSALPTTTPLDVSDQELSRWTGQERAEIFSIGVEAPNPISIRGSFVATEEELRRVGVENPGLGRDIEIALEFAWRPERSASQLRFTCFRLANGQDLARSASPHPSEQRLLRGLCDALSGFRVDKGSPKIGSIHRIRSKRTDRATLTRIAETLHAARDSEDRAVAARWERFEDTMAGFAGFLGNGRFVPIWPQGKQAVLMFQTDTARVPLYLLGSGVQQIVSVVTDLLCSGASIVAIEEPEVHLRTDAQEVLRGILSELPGKDGAPAQVFISSHAPTFELAPTFVHLRRDAHGSPTATVRARKDAAAALHIASTTESGDSETPISWISSDGVLRLSERVRAHIGRTAAGGVVVSISETEARTAEIRSTETFLERFGLDDAADE